MFVLAFLRDIFEYTPKDTKYEKYRRSQISPTCRVTFPVVSHVTKSSTVKWNTAHLTQSHGQKFFNVLKTENSIQKPYAKLFSSFLSYLTVSSVAELFSGFT